VRCGKLIDLDAETTRYEDIDLVYKPGVLYLGSETLPFGDRLAAVPLQGLWAGS
jgi:hypothetical protein